MPTFQAVTRSDSFIGLGNVPAATLRHKVGSLKGSGAVLSGRFGLCTSWAARTYALFGSASNIDVGMVFFCAVLLDAVSVDLFTIKPLKA